jgi:hypothetical protein
MNNAVHEIILSVDNTNNINSIINKEECLKERSIHKFILDRIVKDDNPRIKITI